MIGAATLTLGSTLMGRVGIPREVVWVRVAGGETNAEPVILPRDAMNFCMSPFGGRVVEVEDRLLVDKLRDRPLRLRAGEGVKLGTGDAGLLGEGERFGVEDGVVLVLGRGVMGRAWERGLSSWVISLKSDRRVTYERRR